MMTHRKEVEHKLRGIPRRLRSLKKWSESFMGNYPIDDSMRPANRYWNWKIPVHRLLVEGRQTNRILQAECAQRLIDACGYLIASKPKMASDCRTTCVICLPDIFTSEICIYLDETYFQEHTSASADGHGTTLPIVGRRLSQEWGLTLPAGVQELGVTVDYQWEEDGFSGERWYFGEIH